MDLSLGMYKPSTFITVCVAVEVGGDAVAVVVHRRTGRDRSF